MTYLRYREGFFAILGILLTIAIILVLFYFLINSYYNKPSFEKSLDKDVSGYSVATANYHSVVETTRETVADIEKRLLDRSQQLEKIKY